MGVWRRGCSCVRYTGIARNTDDGGPWAGILSTLEALLPTKQPHLIPLVSHTIATILCLCHAKEKAGEGCAEILHLLRGESWFFKKEGCDLRGLEIELTYNGDKPFVDYRVLMADACVLYE